MALCSKGTKETSAAFCEKPYRAQLQQKSPTMPKPNEVTNYSEILTGQQCSRFSGEVDMS